MTKKIEGAIYKVVSDESIFVNQGDLLRLIHDDGTDMPKFKNIVDGAEMFVLMHRVKLVRDFQEGDKVRFIKKPSKSKTEKNYTHVEDMLKKGDESLVNRVSTNELSGSTIVKIDGYNYDPKDLVLIERHNPEIEVGEGGYYRVINGDGHSLEVGTEVYVLQVREKDIKVVGIRRNSDRKEVLVQFLKRSQLGEI
jgi:hypothetical protein